MPSLHALSQHYWQRRCNACGLWLWFLSHVQQQCAPCLNCSMAMLLILCFQMIATAPGTLHHAFPAHKTIGGGRVGSAHAIYTRTACKSNYKICLNCKAKNILCTLIFGQ